MPEVVLRPDLQFHLTGRWRSNQGGFYYLRQVGAVLWWVGLNGDAYSNVYRGTIQGDTITGEWADVPYAAGARGSGALVLRIEGNGIRLTRVSQTGGFGDSVWSGGATIDVYASYSGQDQEAVGPGQTVHACRAGYAMRGVNLHWDEVHCRRVTSDTASVQTRPDPIGQNAPTTDRQGRMHACPEGMYVRGLHADANVLLCSGPIQVDDTSYDFSSSSVDPSGPVHVCPARDGYLEYMLGIHVDQNFLYCGYARIY
jgi:hypothetical protein